MIKRYLNAFVCIFLLLGCFEGIFSRLNVKIRVWLFTWLFVWLFIEKRNVSRGYSFGYSLFGIFALVHPHMVLKNGNNPGFARKVGGIWQNKWGRLAGWRNKIFLFNTLYINSFAYICSEK